MLLNFLVGHLRLNNFDFLLLIFPWLPLRLDHDVIILARICSEPKSIAGGVGLHHLFDVVYLLRGYLLSKLLPLEPGIALWHEVWGLVLRGLRFAQKRWLFFLQSVELVKWIYRVLRKHSNLSHWTRNILVHAQRLLEKGSCVGSGNWHWLWLSHWIFVLLLFALLVHSLLEHRPSVFIFFRKLG